MVEDLPLKTKLFYFSEMQGWEKTLNIACSRREDIKCIGLQHTIVPLLFLNYFDPPASRGGDDYVKYSPKPDYLACSGDITKNIFIENKWPPEKLFILGGFRFTDFKNREDNF